MPSAPCGSLAQRNDTVSTGFAAHEGLVLMTADNVTVHPYEWHRRGLRSPAEIQALVEARLVHHTDLHEPTYADFLGEQVA